jgi:cellulose synthase/poly-beta-1,6-N-acetylglucosamine synthase-like glycosyltransferase
MITICVTTFKEEKTIGKCLESILCQKIENYEIIVSCPDEPTINVVKKYIEKYDQIKLIRDPCKGKPTALNLIFKEAKGEILVLTDGDVILGENSINFLTKHFKNPKIGAVCGKVIYQIDKNNLFYEWAKLSEKLYDKIRKQQDKDNKLWHPSGNLYAIRNYLIKKIPPNTLSDDAVVGVLIKSKGYLIKYEPNAKVYVKFPSNIKDFIQQKSRTRAGFLQLRKWFSFKEKKISDEILNGFKLLIETYNIKKINKFLLIGLIFFISWLRAYWIIYSKQSLKKVWKRIETTK